MGKLLIVKHLNHLVMDQMWMQSAEIRHVQTLLKRVSLFNNVKIFYQDVYLKKKVVLATPLHAMQLRAHQISVMGLMFLVMESNALIDSFVKKLTVLLLKVQHLIKIVWIIILLVDLMQLHLNVSLVRHVLHIQLKEMI